MDKLLTRFQRSCYIQPRESVIQCEPSSDDSFSIYCVARDNPNTDKGIGSFGNDLKLNVTRFSSYELVLYTNTTRADITENKKHCQPIVSTIFSHSKNHILTAGTGKMPFQFKDSDDTTIRLRRFVHGLTLDSAFFFHYY